MSSSISLNFPPNPSPLPSARSKPPAQSPISDSHRISFPVSSSYVSSLHFSPIDSFHRDFPSIQGFKDCLTSSGTKAKAQLSQVFAHLYPTESVLSLTKPLSKAVAEKSENSAPVVEKNGESKLADADSISQFISQVSTLVRMVDASDITELQLKQLDCEVVIRKKEALQPPPPPPTPFSPFPSYPQYAPPPPPLSVAAAAPAPPPAATPAAPPPAKKSSHPPFKCPMPGTFYRSSAPGAPPFVKVGDKVQKGQVLCIVEAMKLMNEIESDHEGTVTEILVENGSSVSVDTPLFIIE